MRWRFREHRNRYYTFNSAQDVFLRKGRRRYRLLCSFHDAVSSTVVPVVVHAPDMNKGSGA